MHSKFTHSHYQRGACVNRCDSGSVYGTALLAGQPLGHRHALTGQPDLLQHQALLYTMGSPCQFNVRQQPSGGSGHRAKVGGDGLQAAIQHAALHLAPHAGQRCGRHLRRPAYSPQQVGQHKCIKCPICPDRPMCSRQASSLTCYKTQAAGLDQQSLLKLQAQHQHAGACQLRLSHSHMQHNFRVIISREQKEP